MMLCLFAVCHCRRHCVAVSLMLDGTMLFAYRRRRRHHCRRHLFYFSLVRRWFCCCFCLSFVILFLRAFAHSTTEYSPFCVPFDCCEINSMCHFCELSCRNGTIFLERKHDETQTKGTKFTWICTCTNETTRSQLRIHLHNNTCVRVHTHTHIHNEKKKEK